MELNNISELECSQHNGYTLMILCLYLTSGISSGSDVILTQT
jgi:hypothetical protein